MLELGGLLSDERPSFFLQKNHKDSALYIP